MQYPDYAGLKLDRPANGALRITMSRDKVNSMDFQMHQDLTAIWPRHCPVSCHGLLRNVNTTVKLGSMKSIRQMGE